jgi:hypothetical protein
MSWSFISHLKNRKDLANKNSCCSIFLHFQVKSLPDLFFLKVFFNISNLFLSFALLIVQFKKELVRIYFKHLLYFFSRLSMLISTLSIFFWSLSNHRSGFAFFSHGLMSLILNLFRGPF